MRTPAFRCWAGIWFSLGGHQPWNLISNQANRLCEAGGQLRFSNAATGMIGASMVVYDLRARDSCQNCG